MPNLRCHRPRDHVPAREVFGLWRVLLHETLALAVHYEATFTATALRHQATRAIHACKEKTTKFSSLRNKLDLCPFNRLYWDSTIITCFCSASYYVNIIQKNVILGFRGTRSIETNLTSKNHHKYHHHPLNFLVLRYNNNQKYTLSIWA